MYGYLNYKKVKRVDKLFEMYRCYYCGLCHALKRHYGTIATLFLSYDLVFAAIAHIYGNIAARMKVTLNNMRITGNEKEFLYEMVNRVMPERVSRLIKRG